VVADVWVGAGEVLVGRYVGEMSNNDFHGQGTFTAANAGWCFTGALVHDRPTKGELTEADWRRFAVQYAADCGLIYNRPTPSSKVRLGSVALRARTSMVLQRRRRASARRYLFLRVRVYACAQRRSTGHLKTLPYRRPCSRRGAQAVL
jgi:hypothetical protein